MRQNIDLRWQTRIRNNASINASRTREDYVQVEGLAWHLAEYLRDNAPDAEPVLEKERSFAGTRAVRPDAVALPIAFFGKERTTPKRIERLIAFIDAAHKRGYQP
jgi:hypothetical protein